MKTAVLYHSQTGKTKKMAHYIVDGMASIEDIEPKSFNLESIDIDFFKRKPMYRYRNPDIYG